MKKAILILGPTGAGKSSIIATVTGQKQIVGDTMESCTLDIKSYKAKLLSTDESVAFIDTRGFNDSSGTTDIEIFVDLATYIYNNACRNKAAFNNGSSMPRQSFEISGVLFVHSIKETKFTATASTNLNFFKALVGPDFYPRVVLATTMWDNLPPRTVPLPSAPGQSYSLGLEKFEQRQRELEERIWRDLLDNGARSVRFDGTLASVLDMILPLLDDSSPPPLQLLRELDQDRHLGTTSAGKLVSEKTRKAAQKWHKRLLNLDTDRDIDMAEQREAGDALKQLNDQLALLEIELPGSEKGDVDKKEASRFQQCCIF